MHVELHNQKQDYILNKIKTNLRKTELEKDIGVFISNDPKPSKHGAAVYSI